MISFCKSGIKAARLETLEAFLHCGCAQTDFSVAYSTIQHFGSVRRSLS